MRRLVGTAHAAVALLAAFGWTSAGAQTSIVLVDDATPGRYNTSLGIQLDGTQAVFPCAALACGDPTISNPPEPDLTSVGTVLGGWLSSPASPGASWAGPQAIPSTWSVNTETAIIYTIDAGPCGATDVTASLGVDNGIFVWVNGAYRFGALAPGGAVPAEYSVNIGDLPAGTSFVQILREDHGGLTGYTIEIAGTLLTGCPPGGGGGGDDDDDRDDDDDGRDHDGGDDDDGRDDDGHGDDGHGDDGHRGRD